MNSQNCNDLAAAAGASPASLAIHYSRGTWRPLQHLMKLNEKLLDLATGKIRRLIVTCPPRAGKSELGSHWLPVYLTGTLPNFRTVVTSYEASLATSWALRARRTFAEIAPSLWSLGLDKERNRQNEWSATNGSSVFACGAGGPLTGRGADVAIVDDPHANAEEASSVTMRDKVHEWFAKVLLTRLQQGGRVLVLATRWNRDDLTGRLLQGPEKWEQLLIPALDERDYSYAEELFTTEQLRRTRAEVGSHVWQTMFQGDPVSKDAAFFRPENFPIVDAAPEKLLKVRGWDLAASSHGDYTCGALLGRWKDRYIILDCVRGQWPPGHRDEKILEVVKRDGREVRQVFELQPSAAGLTEAEYMRQVFSGFRIEHVPARGPKLLRAQPVAGYSESKRISILRASSWNKNLLDELEAFPGGRHDDQIDALAHSFNALMKSGLNWDPERSSGQDWRARYASCNCGVMGGWPHFPGCPMAGDFYTRNAGEGAGDWRETFDRLSGVPSRHPWLG